MVSYALAAALLSQPAPRLDITYREVAGEALKLDFYPSAQAGSKPSPLVIVLHGGAWVSGTRKDVADFCRILNNQGMSAASISYRLAPRHKWPAQVEDAQAAVQHFRTSPALYGIDPTRIGAAGFSAGGTLALLLGTMETRGGEAPFGPKDAKVKGVLNFYGPTSFLTDFTPMVSAFFAQQLLGKPLDDSEDELRAFSPVNLFTATSAPVFTIHGTMDRIVPVNQAVRLDEAAKKAKVEHVLRLVPDFGHESPAVNKQASEAAAEGIAWLLTKLNQRP